MISTLRLQSELKLGKIMCIHHLYKTHKQVKMREIILLNKHHVEQSVRIQLT